MPWHCNNLIRNWPRVFRLAALVFVVASIALLARYALMLYVATPVVDLTYNVDWGYINTGLDRVSSFTDTARWWTGTWCGEVPFWRPLTSYVFWGMRLLWPPEYMLPRQIVSVTTHLIFVAMAGLLLWRLTRRPWLVLLTLWLFAGFRPYPVSRFFGQIWPVWDVLTGPKNIPDPLVGIAILASLLLLANGRWAAGLVAAAVSVGFKEVGFTTWPLALVALAWIHRDRVMAAGGIRYVIASIRRNWLPVTTWLLVLVLLLAVHFLAVGMGYNCGTNKAWHWRAASYFGGPIGGQLILRDPSPAIVAFLVVVALLALRRSSLLPRFIGVLIALAAGVLVDARLQGITWEVSTVKLLSYNMDLKTILISVFWLLVAWEARRDWQTVALGAAMCFIAAAPSWMAAQPLAHSRYTASLFMEVVVAAALCQSARAISRSWNIGLQERDRDSSANKTAAYN